MRNRVSMCKRFESAFACSPSDGIAQAGRTRRHPIESFLGDDARGGCGVSRSNHSSRWSSEFQVDLGSKLVNLAQVGR